MNGGVCLAIEVDEQRARRRLEIGYVDALTHDPAEALATARAWAADGEGECIAPVGDAAEGGVENAFDSPGFVPAFIRPQFCEGRGPFRWAALSGDPADILRTDRAILELFPDDAGLRRWIEAAGAPWVSIHHGGGVGIGYSQHAGMVVVADGTELAARKLERVLTTDPAMGVLRHADAGYERAIEGARGG